MNNMVTWWFVCIIKSLNKQTLFVVAFEASWFMYDGCGHFVPRLLVLCFLL